MAHYATPNDLNHLPLGNTKFFSGVIFLIVRKSGFTSSCLPLHNNIGVCVLYGIEERLLNRIQLHGGCK